MSIIDMVKNKKVKFLFYKENELWYVTECGFEFPVPISDTQGAVFNNVDKAVFFMRWIKKHLSYLHRSKLNEGAEDGKDTV